MLTDDEKAFWNDNGYLMIPGLLTPEEAAQGRAECHALAQRLEEVRGPQDPTWASSGTRGMTQLIHCHDVQFHSALFARWMVDERITARAADLIGPNVQLHHTKMFIKPPEKGSPFPLHQDAAFIPHERHSLIAVVLHFDDATIEKGCVRVVPGSHKLGLLPHQPEGAWHLDPETYSVEKATPCPAKAGDALFFHYLTIHGSGINASDEARTTVLIQMRDPEDVPTVRIHESHGQGTMLRGFDPTCAKRPAWETGGR